MGCSGTRAARGLGAQPLAYRKVPGRPLHHSVPSFRSCGACCISAIRGWGDRRFPWRILSGRSRLYLPGFLFSLCAAGFFLW